MSATNLTRGTVLADRAVIADSSSSRRTGLLKHSDLLPGEGMWIAPCECVHTFGMRFPIDVVFISKKRKVVRIAENVGKRRILLAIRAQSVLELPAGTIARTETSVGDDLRLQAVKPEPAEERPQVHRSDPGGEDNERKPVATGPLRASCFSPFEIAAIIANVFCLALLAIAYRILRLSGFGQVTDILWPTLVMWPVFALAAAICVSTITTGWRYGIDVLGGAIFAAAAYAFAIPAVRWMEGGRLRPRAAGREVAIDIFPEQRAEGLVQA